MPSISHPKKQKPVSESLSYSACEPLPDRALERRIQPPGDPRYFETVFNGLNDAVCTIDATTFVIHAANRAFDKLYGHGESVVGRFCYEVTRGRVNPCDPDECRCVLQANQLIGQSVSLEHLILEDSKEERIFEVATSSLRADNGQVREVIYALRDVTDRQAAVQEIRHLSNHDNLTGLPNRLLFFERLRNELSQASGDHGVVAVMFLDLDRFKGINDTLGHSVGDKVLQLVAGRLEDSLRRHDIVARIGGDEFVIVLSGLEEETEAERIAGRILQSLVQPFDVDGQEVFCSISIGLAFYPTDGQDEDSLLKNAEFAMYQSKNQGRNMYQRFSLENNAGAVEKLVLETGLRHALERQELFLVYQPQVEAATGQVVGAEALLRWQHPYMGLVPPGKFIPLAEEAGLIKPISEWVLQKVCEQQVTWQRSGLKPVRMGVNLSGCQVGDKNVVGWVSSVLEETGLDPAWLELELTEGSLMEHGEATISILRRLKELGVCLAIDDFGTGYSSLSYLKHFPLDRLKIDRSFVKDIGTERDDGAIAAAVIAMAKTLGLDVIAEGVEEKEQYFFLRERGCEEIQGFFFAKPMPAEDFEGLLHRGGFELPLAAGI